MKLTYNNQVKSSFLFNPIGMDHGLDFEELGVVNIGLLEVLVM